MFVFRNVAAADTASAGNRHDRRRQTLLTGAALCALLSANGTAFAQQGDPPASPPASTPVRTQDRDREPRRGPAAPVLPVAPAGPTRPAAAPGGFLADWIDPVAGGIRLGTFRLYPSLELTGMFDDNVFASSSGKRSDYVGIVSPSLELRSVWKQHALNLWAGADIGRHARFTRENYEDYNAGGDGRYDIAPDFYLFGGVSFDRTHEPRESPDDAFGQRPTIYRDLDGHAGLHKEFGPFTLRFGGTIRWLDYDDVPGSAGTINNDDRDRVAYTIAARLSYRLGRGYELFGQATYDRRDYTSFADDNGYRRSSHGYRAAIGLKAELGRELDGEVYVGYLEQIYDDSRFKPVSNVHFGARLRWLVKPSLLVTGFVDRSVEETTLAGASSYIATRFGLRFEHALAEKWTLLGHASYAENQYQDIARTDDIYSAGIGVRYYIDPRLWAGFDYSYQYRDTTAAGQQYTQNLVMFRLGAELAPPPRRRAVMPAAELARPASRTALYDGFYVGTQFGFGDHITQLDGPREDGTVSARFGKYGWTWGGLAGWGKTIDVVYLGLEAEGDYVDAHWQDSRLPLGRMFAVDRKYSYGGAIRAGYVTPLLALLYGRVGLVRSGFNTQYQQRQGAYAQDNELTGLRFGAGIEVPVTQAIFFRTDYTYTKYSSFGVAVRPGTDIFQPSESLFRIGLIWRFNGGSPFAPLSEPGSKPKFGGFYVAGGVGHNGVGARVIGPREQGASTQDTGFRGQGFALAGFAGYGVVLHNFYLGGEVEADGSWSGWDHRREPRGDDFTQDKLYSVGGSARLGYVLADRALVYGRFGVVLSGFRATFQSGQGTVTRVEQHAERMGLRFGMGVEVPVTGAVFARLDYSHTRYESYTVPHRNGVDVHKPNENLVRLVALYRF